MKPSDNQQIRDAIFTKLRAAIEQRQPVDLPDVPDFVFPGDPLANFKEMLVEFHGVPVEFDSRADAIKWLEERLPVDREAKVYSAVDDFKGNVTKADFPQYSEANIVTDSVFEALYGVGETGSIWVTTESLGFPPAVLFSLNCYALLDRNKILPGIHEFYKTVDVSKTPYGSLYSGPSGTADIEAIHVTGAQGPLAMTVLIYDGTK